jgi:hypothetical protein
MIEYGPILQKLSDDLYNVASVGIGEYQVGRIGDYLPKETLSDILPIVKIISFVVIVVFLGLLFVIKKMSSEPVKPQKESAEVKEAQTAISSKGFPGALTARWEEVIRHMDSNVEAQWRFAIIEADKLVDDLLRRAGFPGDGMGERLMNIKSGELQTIDDLWEAHKLRNRIAHDINYFLRYTEAKRAIGQFEATLRELNAL